MFIQHSILGRLNYQFLSGKLEKASSGRPNFLSFGCDGFVFESKLYKLLNFICLKNIFMFLEPLYFFLKKTVYDLMYIVFLIEHIRHVERSF